MTLTIIFALIIAGSLFLVLNEILTEGAAIVAIFTVIALVINLVCWLPATKDSEVMYERLLIEKTTIESMLSTNKDVDRFELGATVIDYNNRVIKYRTNYNRLVYKDYYSKNVDWSILETIEWK